MPSSTRSKRSTRNKTVIVLGGLAGSGKSTTAAFLKRRFRLRHVSAGDIFRRLAKERGMGLIELGRYAERHPEFDREIDERLVAEARKGGVILDGRATCHLLKKRRIPAICVWLAADPAVSARRIAKRDGLTVKEALAKSRLREAEVARRLKALWGVDTKDVSLYDAVIETDDYTPKEVADLITELVRYGRH